MFMGLIDENFRHESGKHAGIKMELLLIFYRNSLHNIAIHKKMVIVVPLDFKLEMDVDAL